MRNSIILSTAIILALSIPVLSCERCKQECGKAALTQICKDLSVDSGKLTGKINTGADLKNAAEKLGLKARWSYLPIDKIATPKGQYKGQYIAHVFGDHFVVVKSDGSGNVTVLDSAAASTEAGKPKPIANIDDLKAAFSGEVLFLSKDKDLPEDTKPAGPAAVFDPYVMDFEEVFQSDQVEKKVTVKNVGSKDLVISGIRGTCGCQTGVIGEKTIAPGKSTQISVKLVTSARTGPQSLKFYVDSNSTDQPTAQIDLVGNIRPQNVMLYPSSLNFGSIRSGETVNRDIRISDQYGKGLVVSDPKCDSPAVKFSLKKEGTDDYPEYVLNVSISESALKDNLQAKITLKSNHPKQKIIDILVTAILDKQLIEIKKQVPPPVPTPSIPVPELNVFITGGISGKELKHTVILKTPADQKFKVTEVENPLYFLGVSVLPAKAAKDKKQKEIETKVILTLRKTAPAGTISGNIILHTTDPKQPHIKLKVYGIVAEKV